MKYPIVASKTMKSLVLFQNHEHLGMGGIKRRKRRMEKRNGEEGEENGEREGGKGRRNE